MKIFNFLKNIFSKNKEYKNNSLNLTKKETRNGKQIYYVVTPFVSEHRNNAKEYLEKFKELKGENNSKRVR